MKAISRATIQFILIVTVGFVTVTVTSAATYYVATNGSDSNTCSQARSQSTPKKTLDGGIRCLASGDTLEVKAGTYAAPSETVEPPSGTSLTNATTIKRFGSDVVTIQGNMHFGNSGAGGAKSYIVLDGFVIDGQFSGGTGQFIIWMGNGSNHTKISNNEIKNGKNHGLTGCLGCWITGNKIHTGGTDCLGNNPGAAGASCPSRAANVGYNNAIYAGEANQTIEYNEIYDWAGAAISIYSSGASAADDAVIRYNWIHDVGGSYASLGDGRNAPWGIVLGGGNNLQVYGNIITNLRGVASGPDVSNSPYSILVMSSCSNCKVYNNTVYNHRAPGVVVHASGTVIKNNIFWNLSGVIDDQGTGVSIVASNNLCNSMAAGCSVASDPLFVDPARNNFSVQPGSPAIGAGTTSIASGLSLSFNGSAADIGASDYRAPSQPLPSSRPSAPLNLIVTP